MARKKGPRRRIGSEVNEKRNEIDSAPQCPSRDILHTLNINEIKLHFCVNKTQNGRMSIREAKRKE